MPLLIPFKAQPSYRCGKVYLWLGGVIAFSLAVWSLAMLYQQRLDNHRHQAERELQAISQLQVSGVSTWRQQRLTDAMALSDDSLLAQAFAQWQRLPSAARELVLIERLRILQERANYTAVYLVDLQGRLLLPQSTTAQQHLPTPEQQALNSALASAQTVAVEPHRDPFFAFPFFSVLAPLFDGTQPLGAVWLVSDVRAELYPLLQTWPTASLTAESSIVSRDAGDALFLSPLRHLDAAELRYRIPLDQDRDPAVQVLAGTRGIFYSRDYRGKDTMAMLSAVPASPWYLVSKIDTDEVFAATRVREGLALSLPISVGLLLLGLVFALSQRRGRLREQALKDTLQRNMLWLEGAQKSAAIGYFAYDKTRATITLSSMGCAVFGWEGGEVMRLREWIHLLHPEDRKAVLHQHKQTWLLRQPLRMQYRIRRANDGATRWVQIWGEYEASSAASAALQSVEGGRVTGTVQDITERKQTEQELANYRATLEKKVRLDPLTRIANRRALDEHVSAQWQRAARQQRTLSLLMLDIDHFKHYNDHYGHVEGDECLKRVAHALAAMVSRTDEIVARYGGEEFAVLLPDTDAAAALVMAQKICDAVRNLGIAHAASATAPCVTISIGVASIRPVWSGGGIESGDEADGTAAADKELTTAMTQALFEQADAALYTAKQQGRNRAFLQP